MLGHVIPVKAAKAILLFLAAASLSIGGEAAQIRPIEPTELGTCDSKSLNPLQRQIHTICPPVLTDVKRLRPFRNPPKYPWTHPVRCLKTVSNSTAAPLGTRGRQRTYCLYSEATYGNLHGMSIVTSPEIAVDLVGADALEDRPSYGGSGKRVFQPGPVIREGTKPVYTLKPSPGKGLGVFATRKIAQGEIIMLDFPAMLLSKAFLEDAQPLPRRRLIRRGLAQLPEATQDRVFALSKSTGGDELDAILGTNTISLSLGMNELHLGLYPELARINHACGPNSYYRFSPKKLSVEVVAYRDIQPNEEITISYAQLTLSRTARREFLQQNWHFNCTCSLCRADTDAMTLSEDRRRDMRKFQSTLVQASRDGNYDLALLTAENLMEVTEAEGVTPLKAEMYDILASIYLDMGNFNNAEKFGRRALEDWERFDSVDDSQLQNARWFLRFVEETREAQRRERERQEKERKEEEEIENALEDDFF